MSWTVLFHPDFEKELKDLPENVQDELFAHLGILERFGPALGRPRADTLNGSRYANMKELRLSMDGVWRFAFAFDPERKAVVLCGGNKQGVNERRFYKRLIAEADRRYSDHMAGLSKVARK